MSRSSSRRPTRPAAGAGGRPETDLVVAVRVKPGASRARIGGCHPGSQGPALVVAVTAPAVDGRATEAARHALAAALEVPTRRITLRAGAASRDKLFKVDTVTADEAEVLDARLRRLRDG
ncbi:MULTISPECIES: DUF167 domain-containing protein [unclassified Solwaraspora]|uniref:DUF167 domain-containing protein n=1 Tax=unclassified Solwaraspora TaxID=2627926 RepID=UPI00248B993A|nr:MULTISPECIES: DUF167 domain-containing protein [unclassified Solwaraspora]WBB94966.1 DUF167 domain-containing protein [Solwaraspora sp. WMMA2059]WBC21151.1 DUF167 domain-containing protein [Solwaraspora sp. WMMA2080]WJK36767.1 DUF167 domain-containing protein [Solwaraspora sp. WMMA2065]